MSVGFSVGFSVVGFGVVVVVVVDDDVDAGVVDLAVVDDVVGSAEVDGVSVELIVVGSTGVTVVVVLFDGIGVGGITGKSVFVPGNASSKVNSIRNNQNRIIYVFLETNAIW